MNRKVILTLIVWSLSTACADSATPIPAAPLSSPTLPVLSSTPSGISTELVWTPSIDASPVPAEEGDVFTQMNISLPAPSCTSITQSQMEGPYYKAGSPERNSLLEEGMEGTRLILVGYVLDQNCQPLPNAWLDFWQADSSGEYDNQGYQLRGHQYTDAQGRYYLETVFPGLYQSRPIEHIHVKVQPESGQEITSQLYFPNQPMEGLTVSLEDRGDFQVGYFNFVIER